MNARRLLLLGAVAVVIAGLALWSIAERAPQQDVGLQGPLLPDLAARLNEIEQVKVVGGGSATLVTLNRSDDGWHLAERGGYPADAGKVRALLMGLTDAQKVAAKTSNPELHYRLSVEDVADADAQGVRVELSGGGPDLKIILGDNSSQGKGTYVRLDGEAASWLVDGNITAERKPVEWLQRELVNVPSARVMKVSVVPIQGQPIEIAREAGVGGDFKVQNLPRGREPASEFVADATAGLIDSLRFDDVVESVSMTPGDDGARTATFTTVEGLRVVLSAWKVDGKTYAAFSAALDSATADAWANAPASDKNDVAAATQAADAVGTDDTVKLADTEKELVVADATSPATKRAALDAELKTLQERFAGRVFVLPAFKATNLERDLDAYLKPKA